MIWQFVVVALIGSLAYATEPPYTEDVPTFKDKNYNARLEMLVGCWLMVKDHTQSHPQPLPLIKLCMRKATRKDCVTKVTSLINKNKIPVKALSQILTPSQLLTTANSNEPFDSFLQQQIDKYQEEFKSINPSEFEGELFQKRVEQELKKREYKYFGVIPANRFTHTILLVGMSLLFIGFCTCLRFRRKKEEKKTLDRKSYEKKALDKKKSK